MERILKNGEPDVKSLLAYHYGLQAGAIIRIAGGTVGRTYRINDSFLLKIYDTGTAIGRLGLDRLPVQTQVLKRLQTTALADRICRPVQTGRGELFFAQDSIAGAMFSFIPGEAVGYARPYTEQEVFQLADMVKKLHAVRGGDFEGICPSETYQLSFCGELEQLLISRTELLPEPFREETEREKEMLLSRIRQLRAAALELEKAALPYVLCHTDIHGGNLIRDPQGRLWLIDWENVMLAPKEADLFCFCEEEYAPLFCGDADERALRYYLLRRDLEDVQEFLDSVLNGEYDRAAQQEVFSHVKRILGHMRGMDGGLEALQGGKCHSWK
ncbi:MAG TPA: aminoglycoside phosphotransferase family protein [Candidatus Eisenbergiella merdavium]|uniref:Aminoglycoside phosphotransferase family protein n=1 Tax=Candidatus Eisenbergiella merdavium TaxID=2838551 RepID=A0A9D2SS75_9FIRM|nr:aminoglycoside phosphotransferase family protein [Candidatus Eisenbergiella merdavium]